MIKTCSPLLLLAALLTPLHAQTLDDGIMMPKRDLCAGSSYSRDTWDQYWEGALKRTNGNIGKLTTQTNVWFANYGITDRLNVIAMVPYVRTDASQGVLLGMKGFQDITLAGKFSFLERQFGNYGKLRAIAVATGAIPLTNYTPDFQPLSIGTASKRVTGRFTLHFHSNPGWFLNGSLGYTWRSNVTLDRPYYFTDGQLFLTNIVEMPQVFDYVLSAGYLKHGLNTEFSFRQQRTQGGGDIRRQDMPFVSNRMNYSQVGAMALYTIPRLRKMEAKFALAYIIDGRNVGQSTTLTATLQYRFSLHKGTI
jgi:hypothetical protein